MYVLMYYYEQGHWNGGKRLYWAVHIGKKFVCETDHWWYVDMPSKKNFFCFVFQIIFRVETEFEVNMLRWSVIWDSLAAWRWAVHLTMSQWYCLISDRYQLNMERINNQIQRKPNVNWLTENPIRLIHVYFAHLMNIWPFLCIALKWIGTLFVYLTDFPVL